MGKNMKNLIIITLAITAAVLFQSFAFAGKIKNFILDKTRIYDIKVAANATGTTTVMFPSPIGSIQGANVTQKAGENAGFVITANKGSYFFSLQSQKARATGSLNIVYDHQIFVLRLEMAKEADAYSSVTFQSTDQVYGQSTSHAAATPTLIRDLIEKARLYPVLKKKYPDYYENIEIAHINQLFKYTGYSITLENVYRFKSDDTNIFQIILKNNTEETLAFNPHLIAVRLNSKMYYSSVTVASGKIPAHGQSPVWFAITGTSEGGKNQMAAKNNWQVLLTASRQNIKKSTIDINSQVIEKEQNIKIGIAKINQRLGETNLSDGEIDLLGNKITSLNHQLSELESYHKISKQ
jgi:hypothetical protein